MHSRSDDNSTDRWEEWRASEAMPRSGWLDPYSDGGKRFLTISRDSLRCMSASIDQNEALNAALLLNMVI